HAEAPPHPRRDRRAQLRQPRRRGVLADRVEPGDQRLPDERGRRFDRIPDGEVVQRAAVCRQLALEVLEGRQRVAAETLQQRVHDPQIVGAASRRRRRDVRDEKDSREPFSVGYCCVHVNASTSKDATMSAPGGIPEDLLDLYFSELGKVRLLTAEDEVRLAQTIEAGREAEARLAAGDVDDAERERLERLVREGK